MSYSPYHLVQYETPVSGATISVGKDTEVVFIKPAGTLGALTISFPDSPINGSDIIVATTQTLTTLSVTGGSFEQTISTLSANGYFRFMYSSDSATWFRMG